MPFRTDRLLRDLAIASIAAGIAASLRPVPAVGSPVYQPENILVSGSEAPVSALPADPIQPATRLTTAFLRTVAPPTAAYDDIVRLTPSVVSIAPNGPGLAENADLTIRGFADGQYNVTFDGIPFGDTDDFTHHSTAYFASQALRSVAVDRGPGSGATIGNATFGGTIALLSIDPAQQPGGSASQTVGSFETHRTGLRLDSGRLARLHDLSLVVEAEHLTSDGFLTGTGSTRSNLFAKAVLPIDESLTLTAAGATAWLHQLQPPGATIAQIDRFGPNFGLTDDPAQQNFAPYNGETYRTDFAYVGLHWAGPRAVSIDEKAYTYGLYRHFSTGADVNGETPDGTTLGADDVPGQLGRNGLRAWGDVLRLERAWQAATLRLGLWGEYQANARSLYEVDLSRDGALDPILAPVAGVADSAAIDRAQRDSLVTLQPYAEIEWRPLPGMLPGLTLLPGLKWSYAARQVAAPLMEDTRLPTDEHAEYDALLPSLVVRQRLAKGWSVYAQAAEGFLAPQLQLLDTTTGPGQVSPERSWNLQLGSNLAAPGYSAALDGYAIQFDNLTGTRTIGAETMAFSQGGATYLGLEAEATIALGAGFSLYGNASLNRGRDHDSGAPIPNTPQATLAGGLLYRSAGWFGALTEKWVGARFGDTDRQAGLDPFQQLDLSVGRTVTPNRGLPPLRIALQAQNLLDSTKIDALAGYTVASGTPLWFTQPGRSLWLTLSVAL
jgi:iron complex outermembrane receptor protein